MTPEDESFLKELALRAKLENKVITLEDVSNTPIYDLETRKNTLDLWQKKQHHQ
jgi:hypothetical protein